MEAPTSLILDARAIGNSGIGVYIKALLPFILASKKFDVTVLGQKDSLGRAGFSSIDTIECKAGIYSLREQFMMPLKVSSCDIFWTPHYNVPALPVRARKRIVTIHDVYHLAHSSELNLVKRLYAKVVLPLAARLSDRIITVSDFSRQEILKYAHIGPEKIVVIYNGVDFDRFNKAKVNSAFLDRYHLGRYILYVGNVKPHKNITGLIDAFRILHDKYADIKLVIAGEKEQFITGVRGVEQIVKTRSLERHVIFTGFVDDKDLPGLYKGAELMVFPSLYEGFGLPPLEAMASGTPVVASRGSSIPEICGEAPIYVDPYNPLDMADAIARVLEDGNLRDNLIKRGLERSRAFRWEGSARTHIRLLEELAGGILS